ncbi:MAG: GNAT family N-acetyltransferase [Verrucomicrobiota bacterium]
MSLISPSDSSPEHKAMDSAQLLASMHTGDGRPDQKPVRVRLDFKRLGLRSANEGDYEFFYQLKKAALGDYIRATWGWDEDRQLDFHFREWRPETLDIITLDIKPIGSQRLRVYSEEVHLGQFYLRPTFQKLGIGGLFLQQAKGRAEQAGLPLRLEVLKCNAAALRFYRRFGFEPERESKTHHHLVWRAA